MPARGTLDALVVPVAKAVGDVGAILAVDNGEDLMTRLGYKLPAGSDLPALFNDVAASATALTDAIVVVADAYADGSYEEPSFLEKVLDLIAAVVKAIKTADGLPARAQAAIADPVFCTRRYRSAAAAPHRFSHRQLPPARVSAARSCSGAARHRHGDDHTGGRLQPVLR